MAETASDCLFCKIGSGEIEADVVHRSEHVVGFRDINPQAPTHILIIPTDHIESVAGNTARPLPFFSMVDSRKRMHRDVMERFTAERPEMQATQP